MEREDEIRNLCKQVLSLDTIFYDNPNGPYEYSCPFCFAEIGVGGHEKRPTMETLPHDPNCAYLIAKSLMTGIM